jgi:hypothetical protein
LEGDAYTLTPDISFTTGVYTGTADVWYAVVANNAGAPVNMADYTYVNRVGQGGHTATIAVDSEKAASGTYDIYVVISKDGKVSAPALISVVGGQANVTAVWGVDLDASITAPATGNSMNTTFTNSDSRYSGGNVTWYNGSTTVSGNFADNVQYTAQVILTATNGYTFAGVNASAFTYTGATVAISNNTGTNVTLRITFPATTGPATTVTDMNLRAYIPAPLPGEEPVESFSGSQYTGNVSWTSDFSQSWSTFIVDHGIVTYTVTGTLTADTSYTFNGVGSFTYIYPDATVTTSNNTGNTITIEITIPADTGLSSVLVDLSPYIDRPMDGAFPTTGSIETDNWRCDYISASSWSRNDGGAWAGGPFSSTSSYSYTLTVYLQSDAIIDAQDVRCHNADIVLSYNYYNGWYFFEITFPPRP